MNLSQLSQILKIVFLLFYFFSISYALEFTSEEKNWIKKNPIVIVGGEADWAPFDFAIDGAYTGIANDYLKLLSKKTGLKFTVKVDTWNNLLLKVKRGEIGLLPALYYTQERSTYLHYTRHYFEMLNYFFIRDDLKITTMKELDGKIVAIPKDFANRELLKKDFPQIQILIVGTFLEAIDAVLEKKADILFDSYASLTYALEKRAIHTIIPFKSYRMADTMKLYMAMSKMNPMLATIIDKGLAAVSEIEKNKIYKKWIGNRQNVRSGVTFTDKELQWLRKNKTLTFMGDPDWLPFEAFDKQGNYTGIISNFLHEVEKITLSKIMPKQTNTWQETIQLATENKIDIVSGIVSDENNFKDYKAIEAYLTTPIAIIAYNQYQYVSDILEVQDIKDKKIGLVKDYGYVHLIYQMYPDLTFVEYANADKLIQALSQHKVDLALLSLPKATYALKINVVPELNLIGKIPLEMQLTFLVHKDKKVLHGILDKVMQHLKVTKHNELIDEWFSIKFSKKNDYSFAYWVAAVLGIFLLLMYYWTRKLSKEVKNRKESEEQVKMILESIPLQLIVTAYDGQAIMANQYAYDAYAYTEEDLANINVTNFYRHAEDRMVVLEGIAKEGRVDKKIVQFKYPDGSIHDLLLSVLPIVYERQKCLLTISVDLTERLEIEKELEKAKEAAESANEAKSQFLANMSHEIRTPMNAIIGFTELLNESVKEPRLKGYIKTIKNAGHTLLTLINDILDLSKIEAGKLEIHKRATNLSDLGEEVLSIFMMVVREKGLDLILDSDENIPKSVLLDDIRLRQVLVNLIGNAVKFTDKGFVKLRIQALNIDEHLSKVDLEISIEDSGMGIPQEQLDSIFRSFEQQIGQDNRKYGGTGLGLSISRRLTEMMGGKIVVKSKEGEGSKFFVLLKHVDISSIQLTDKREEAFMAAGIIFKSAKLLVVDDIEDNCELIVQNFADTELEVFTASDGYEAIEQYKSKKPDMILMDIRMPNMDGYEAAKQIKLLDKTVPIVALTASIMKDEYEQIKRKYFDGYLRKPVLKNELFLELSHFLAYDKALPSENIVEELGITLSKDTLLNHAKILDVMEQEIEPLYQKAMQTNSITDIKVFISKVQILAQMYKVDFLIDYVQRLDEAIDVFDIGQIQSLLHEYSVLRKKFELLN